MIYCHVAWTMREADFLFRDFVRDNENKLVKISKINLMTLDKDGNQHHFMSGERYNDWCIGRKYIWNGETYESGIKIAEMRNEE